MLFSRHPRYSPHEANTEGTPWVVNEGYDARLEAVGQNAVGQNAVGVGGGQS